MHKSHHEVSRTIKTLQHETIGCPTCILWQETLGSDGMPMLYGVKIYTLLLDRLYQTSYHLGKNIESA